MQRLKFSGVVRLIYRSLGVKRLNEVFCCYSDIKPERKQKRVKMATHNILTA